MESSLQLCPRQWQQEHVLTTKRLKLGLDGQASRKLQARQLQRICTVASGLRDNLVRLSPPTCGKATPKAAIEKWPQPTSVDRRREAALREALLAGAVPMRDPHKMAMLKPKVMRYEPNTGHLANCTSCFNQQRAAAAARMWTPRVASGQAVLLMDDAALSAWEGVVHELEVPRKQRTRFPRDTMVGGFGMPGTVLHENGKYRAWLGQAQQRYFESTDGLTFIDPPDSVAEQVGPTTLRWGKQIDVHDGEAQHWWGEMGQGMTVERNVRQETFTVMKDPQAPPEERYKAAFTCDAESGHTPYPDFYRYKMGQLVPRKIWLEAPWFKGEKVYSWESTCLGYSRDGLRWMWYDLGHQQGVGPEPLRMYSDTANALYRDLNNTLHFVANRWSAPIPPGTHGTPMPNPNWWREVRGVRISTAAELQATGLARGWTNREQGVINAAVARARRRAQDFASGREDAEAAASNARKRVTKRLLLERKAAGVAPPASAPNGPRNIVEAAHWIFDRTGKDEHLRRQVYSLQVTPWPDEGLYVGFLNVLEWPKLMNPSVEPPYAYDVMRTYLATSRDGVHFDLEWVYAEQEVVPHGKCRPAPYCIAPDRNIEGMGMEQPFLDSLILNAGVVPFEELCCPFDHGIVIPASTLLTVGGRHQLYYEGRQAFHENRYRAKYPKGIGLATWPKHRLAGLKADPRAFKRGGLQCGVVQSKELNLSSFALAHFTVNVGFRAEDDSTASATFDASSALFAEVLPGCGAAEKAPLRSFEHSIPLTADSPAAVLRWVEGRATVSAAEVGTVRLRFAVCGSAKLFSFTVWSGVPDRSGAAPSPPQTSPSGGEGQQQQQPLPPPPEPPSQSSQQKRTLTDEEYLPELWRWRVEDLQNHAVAYGHCEEKRRAEYAHVSLQPVPGDGKTDRKEYAYSDCPLRERPSTCSMFAGLVTYPLHPRGMPIEGVESCRAQCLLACPTCRFASLSWNEYACDCVEDCKPDRLVVPQFLDDEFPELATVHRMRLARSQGAGGDEVFDWVTFPLRLPVNGADARSSIQTAEGEVPRFPRELWRTSREWAADWLRYAAALNASGAEIVPTAWWKSTPKKQMRRTKSDPAYEMKTKLLTRAQTKSLGLQHGFCAVTTPDNVATSLDLCQYESKGSIPLQHLMTHAGEEPPYSWGSVLEACTAFCNKCDACNFISVSWEQEDCSWYRQCESTNTKVNGFYTKPVTHARIKRKPRRKKLQARALRGPRRAARLWGAQYPLPFLNPGNSSTPP